jgi:hypothetical protein
VCGSVAAALIAIVSQMSFVGSDCRWILFQHLVPAMLPFSSAIQKTLQPACLCSVAGITMADTLPILSSSQCDSPVQNPPSVALKPKSLHGYPCISETIVSPARNVVQQQSCHNCVSVDAKHIQHRQTVHLNAPSVSRECMACSRPRGRSRPRWCYSQPLSGTTRGQIPFCATAS